MTDAERFEDLVGAYLERVAAGEALVPEEYAAQHPEHEQELREALADQVALHLAFGSARAAPGEGAAAPPARIGDYRILQEIGRGGMGVVYEAEQISLHRRVALKVLSSAVTASAQAVLRFQREGRAAARVHHTNVAPVYGMGCDDGRWFYAMELVEGPSLADVIEELGRTRDRPRPSAADSVTSSTIGTDTTDPGFYSRLARAFAGVAHGLHAGHREGVVHRDVKPSNLILTPDGVIKVVDFGLARLLDDETPTMTLTGSVIGTPAYMSPEQTGRTAWPVDARTDVYSLGATLYELLTLEEPVGPGSRQDVWLRITTTQPARPRARNRHVPRDLETIVLKAMEKEPHRRYATAEDLARDLERFAEGAPIAARAVGPLGRAWRKVRLHRVRSALAAGAVVLAGLALALGLAARSESRERRRLQYEALLVQGSLLVAERMSHVFYSEFDPLLPSRGARGKDLPGASAHDAPEEDDDVLDRALALVPERHEAWWLRALTPGHDLGQRLADLEEARARGLGAGTAELARLYLRSRAGELPLETARAIGANPPEPASAHEAVFVAYFQNLAGRGDEALATLSRAVETSAADRTERYLLLRLRASIREARREYAGAVEDLRAVLGLGEETPDVLFRIARLWKRYGDGEAADHAANEARDWARRRGTPVAWRQLVRACAGHGAPWFDPVTQEALAGVPDDPVLMAHRADALSLGDAREEALRLASAAARLAPGDLLVLHALALVKARSGDTDGALEVLRGLAADDHTTNERIGYLLARRGRSDEAVPYLERACRQRASCPESARELAKALGAAGRVAQGRAEFDRAVGLAPYAAGILAERGSFRWNFERDAEGARADFEASLRLDPDLAFSHANLGILDRNEGRHVEALAHFERARDLEPHELQHHRDVVGELLALRRLDEAEEAAASALELVPDDPEGFLLRARVRLARGDREAATADVQAARDLGPEDPETLFGMARLLRQLRQIEEARDLMRRSLGRKPTSAGYNDLGNLLMSMGDRARAEEAFETARRLDEGNPAPWFNLGRLLQAAEKHEAALKHFERAIANWGRSYAADLADVHARKAQCLVALNRLDQARAALDEGVRIAPRHAGILVARGAFLHDRAGDPAGALLDFEAACALAPRKPTVHLHRAIALRALEKKREALQACDEAIGLGASGLQVAHLRASLLTELELHEQAVEAWRAARRLAPPEQTVFALQEGNALLALERWTEALAAFQAVFVHESDNPRAVKGAALAHEGLGQVHEALRGYLRAAELAPGWGSPHWCRAHLLERQEQAEAAIEAYRASIAAEPSWPWPYNDLALLLRKRGELHQAHDLLTRAIEEDGGYVLARRNRASLLMQLNRWQEALADTQKLLELEGESAVSHGLAGDVLWHLGEHRRALERYARAGELEGAQVWPIRSSIAVLHELGEYEEARSLVEKALDRFPDDVEVRTLALANLLARGRAAEARERARGWVEGLPRAGILPAIVFAAAGAAEAAREAFAAQPAEGEGEGHAPGEGRHDRARAFAWLGDLESVKTELAAAVAKGFWLPPNARLDPAFLQHEGKDRDLDGLYAALRAARPPGRR